MPSGSKKADYSDKKQYEKQLQHSRAWKKRNGGRVKRYNLDYNRRKRQSDAPDEED